MKKRGIHSRKKSQLATEHLVIVGLVLVILIPAAYFLVTYKGYSSDAVKSSKIENAANEIVKAANNLYNYGTESKTTIEVSIPEGVQSIDFEENEIIFNYLTSTNEVNELAKAADTELVGVTIENPVPGTQKFEIINLNLRVCVTLFGIPCPFCPGVSICDGEYYCEPGNPEGDGVCPNDYFPTSYITSGGKQCGTSSDEECYDPDCASIQRGGG